MSTIPNKEARNNEQETNKLGLNDKSLFLSLVLVGNIADVSDLHTLVTWAMKQIVASNLEDWIMEYAFCMWYPSVIGLSYIIVIILLVKVITLHR